MVQQFPKLESRNVWGKTMAATGGTIIFLFSLIFWGGSGSRSFPDAVVIAGLNLVSLLPVVAALVPRVGHKVQGGIILAVSILVLSIWSYIFSGIGSVYLLTVLIVPMTLLIVIGGMLVLLSPS